MQSLMIIFTAEKLILLNQHLKHCLIICNQTVKYLL